MRRMGYSNSKLVIPIMFPIGRFGVRPQDLDEYTFPIF